METGMVEYILAFVGRILPFAWSQPEFMQRALLAVLLLSPMCAGMGVLVISFRMAFFSDAISHSAFTGIALGVLLGLDPRVSLVVFGVLVGLAITRTKRRSSLSTDTVIGVFLAGAVALGVTVISARQGLTRTLQSFLYGDVLTISNGEIALYGVLFLAVLIFLGWTFNRLTLIAFNQPFAMTRENHHALYEYCFTMLLALVVTMSIRAVGLLLITALLVVPAATARNLARSMRSYFWIAVTSAVLSAVTGLAGSFYWNSATGATMVLMAVLLFFASALVRPLLVGGGR
jgi:zinc transport system permease protein